MDQELIIIISVIIIFGVWQYFKDKKEKELDERLQRHFHKIFNKRN